MQWEHISAQQLNQAAKEDGVCIVPMGCLEKHSEHLPLGTDSLLVYKLASLAAELESAVVFPPQHYMMVASAAAQPGAVVFDAKLSMEISERLFEEISRNGFKKIILYNFHGGNRNIIPLLLQNHAARQPLDYQLYMPEFDWVVQDLHADFCETDFGDHADEAESSLMLYLFPDLVNMKVVPDDHVGLPQNRLEHLRAKNIKTPFGYYADYPTHYSGMAKFATTDKGYRMVQAITKRLADVIKAVKADSTTAALQQEFSDKMFSVSG